VQRVAGIDAVLVVYLRVGAQQRIDRRAVRFGDLRQRVAVLDAVVTGVRHALARREGR